MSLGFPNSQALSLNEADYKFVHANQSCPRLSAAREVDGEVGH